MIPNFSIFLICYYRTMHFIVSQTNYRCSIMSAFFIYPTDPTDIMSFYLPNKTISLKLKIQNSIKYDEFLKVIMETETMG